MKFSLFIGFVFSIFLTVSAQHPLRLNLSFHCNNQPFVLANTIQDLNGDLLKAQEIAFYMSNLKITHDGGQVLDFGDSVFYVHIRNSIFDLGVQDVQTVESIQFLVGVPAQLNHTDISTYPEHHPLYFQTPSMHWGWTAGYTFFLIDAMVDVDGDLIPETEFQLHCLGDENAQLVTTPTGATIYPDGTREIVELVNIDQWMKNVDLKTVGAQHGSTGINADVMQNISLYPVFTAPANLGTSSLESIKGELNFTADPTKLTVFWSQINGLHLLKLYAIDGKEVASVSATTNTGSYAFNALKSGSYFLKLTSENGEVLNQIQVIQP